MGMVVVRLLEFCTGLWGISSLDLKKCVRLGYSDKCALVSHSLSLGDEILFSAAVVLFKLSSWRDGLIRELVEIQLEEGALNREEMLWLFSA